MGFYITEASGIDEKDRYRRETENGTMIVRDTTMHGERVRLLLVNGVQESATHLDPERKYVPLFRYLDSFHKILLSHPYPEKVLLLGGAGFAYPKLFFSSGQTGELTVVEMDPRMIRLARRFFFLNDLEREYDLARSGRLKIIEKEALSFLKGSDEKWDVILNDAYIGNVTDAGLLSPAGIRTMKDHLAPGGICVTNLITPLSGDGSYIGIVARRLYEATFSEASLTPCDPTHPSTMRQNCMLVGRL